MTKVVYQDIKRLVDMGGTPDLLTVSALSGKSVTEILNILDKNNKICKLVSGNKIVTDGFFYHILESDWIE